MPEPFREMVRGCLRWDPADRISIKDAKGLLAGYSEFSEAAEPAGSLPPVQESRASEKKEEAAIPAEPVDSFRQQEVEFAPRSRLFSNVEEDEEHAGRKGSIVVAVLVLLAIVAVVAWRGFRGRLIPSRETQNVPAASEPAPKPAPLQSDSGSTAPAPTTSNPPASTPAQGGSESQSASAAQPAPESPQTTAPAPKPEEPVPSAQTKNPPVSKPGGSASQTGGEPPAGEAANGKGAVVKRIVPNVESGASESMRRGAVDVELRVHVNEEGSVSNVEYMTQGPGNYFARKARQAAQAWRFKPPQSDGQPMASEWVLLFRFERHKTDVTATELH
jgi:protein TonB